MLIIVVTERPTHAITDSRFCLLGKVVVDIRVRYSEASLTLVAGTAVPKDRSGNDPEIIYSAGVRGVTPRKGAYALRIRS